MSPQTPPAAAAYLLLFRSVPPIIEKLNPQTAPTFQQSSGTHWMTLFLLAFGIAFISERKEKNTKDTKGHVMLDLVRYASMTVKGRVVFFSAAGATQKKISTLNP